MNAKRIVHDGVLLGGPAYLAVAAFYAIFDILAARGSLYTVDLLGKVVFRGARDPAILQYPVVVDMTTVMQYNALHLALSLLIGMVIAWLIAAAEGGDRSARGALFALAAGFFITVAAVGFATTPIRELLPWWSIVAANVAAVVVAGAGLVWRRPEVLRALWPARV